MGDKIGKEFVDIADSYMLKTLNVDINLDWKDFGTAGRSYSVSGNHRYFALSEKFVTAMSNALMFLGDPRDMIDLELEEKKEIDDELLKLTFRLGFLAQSIGYGFMIKTNKCEILIPITDPLYKVIESQRSQALDLGMLGSHLSRCQVVVMGWQGKGYSNEKVDKIIADWRKEYALDIELANTVSVWREKHSESTQYHRSLVQSSQSNQNCFIATAAFGTPMANEIDILRMWRDISLRKSFAGRIFIKIYYSFFGPILAWFISKSKLLRWMTRLCLKPVISIAKNKNKENLEKWRLSRF